MNLWEPADGPAGHDYGAHGVFDDRSRARAPQVWASRHHAALGALAGAVAGFGVGVVAWRRAAAG